MSIVGCMYSYDPAVYATIWGFWKHPEKIWELLHDFMRSSDPTPNPAHTALADLQKMGYLKSIVTQNVDNLHQDAGSTNVIEYHGSLLSVRCLFLLLINWSFSLRVKWNGRKTRERTRCMLLSSHSF